MEDFETMEDYACYIGANAKGGGEGRGPRAHTNPYDEPFDDPFDFNIEADLGLQGLGDVQGALRGDGLCLLHLL